MTGSNANHGTKIKPRNLLFEDVISGLIRQTIGGRLPIQQTADFLATSVMRAVTDELTALGLSDEFCGCATTVQYTVHGWLAATLTEMRYAAILKCSRESTTDIEPIIDGNMSVPSS
jgi:hypothetical protein